MDEKVMKLIKEKAENIEYGRVILEINKTANHYDVITEERSRVPKIKKGEMRKG